LPGWVFEKRSPAWAAQVLPLKFWSPSDFWKRIGVDSCPCKTHGWSHSKHVRVRSFRSPRLIKDGHGRHFGLSAGDAICAECQRMHGAIKAALKLAEAQGAAACEIEELKKRLKATTYTFSVAAPEVTTFFGERFPFIPAVCDFQVTHRAALTKETVNDVVRAARTQQGPADMEKKYDEMLAIEMTRTSLAVVAVQALLRKHLARRATLDSRLRDPAEAAAYSLKCKKGELRRRKRLVSVQEVDVEEAEAEYQQLRALPSRVGTPAPGTVVADVLPWEHFPTKVAKISDTYIARKRGRNARRNAAKRANRAAANALH
jgi:hypothetical protein